LSIKPWRPSVSELYQPLDKAGIVAKHVNQTVTRASHIVVLGSILQSESDAFRTA
jgi:hypothetical protein